MRTCGEDAAPTGVLWEEAHIMWKKQSQGQRIVCQRFVPLFQVSLSVAAPLMGLLLSLPASDSILSSCLLVWCKAILLPPPSLISQFESYFIPTSFVLCPLTWKLLEDKQGSYSSSYLEHKVERLLNYRGLRRVCQSWWM